MVEEPRHSLRQIGRDELVAGAARQPRLEEARGGDRAGRDQDFEAGSFLEDALDQRQRGGRFADAGRVHPDQRLVGTLAAGNTETLGKALTVFLAAPAPRSQVDHDKRGCRGGQAAVQRGEDHRRSPPANSAVRSIAPAGSRTSEGAGPCPTRLSAEASMSSMYCSTTSRARSMPASSRSCSISIGSPHRKTPRPKGSARCMRSQVRRIRRRLVANTIGMIGTLARRATLTMPALATIAGPAGPSGVTATQSPAASSLTSARKAALPPCRVEPATDRTPK